MSTWWLLYALILIGFAGILLFALMDMAQKEEDRAAKLEKRVESQLLGLPELHSHWGTNRSRKPTGKLGREPKRGARLAA